MTKKTLGDRVGALHPSKNLSSGWMPVVRQRDVMEKQTRCTLFSDGNHRIAVAPDGVRTKCLCGALR